MTNFHHAETGPRSLSLQCLSDKYSSDAFNLRANSMKRFSIGTVRKVSRTSWSRDLLVKTILLRRRNLFAPPGCLQGHQIGIAKPISLHPLPGPHRNLPAKDRPRIGKRVELSILPAGIDSLRQLP